MDGLILAVGMMAALLGGYENVAEDYCRTDVERQLAKLNLSLKEMTEVTWYTDRFREGRHAEPGPPSSFRLYARPASCECGRLAVMLWTDCSITDIYTTGDCAIEGVREAWW